MEDSYNEYLFHTFYAHFKSTENIGAKETTRFENAPKELKEFYDTLAKNPALKKIYKIIIENLLNHHSANAIFYADKLRTLLNNHSIVIYLLGNLFSQAKCASPNPQNRVWSTGPQKFLFPIRTRH